MREAKYTLLHSPFKRTIVEGVKAAQEVDQEDPILVGGAATQLYTGNPLLYRPTNDVDIAPKKRLKNAEIKRWGIMAHMNLADLGHDVESRESRMGYQVEFLNFEEPLFLHLDNITSKTWEAYNKFFAAQYERAKLFQIRNTSIRVVSPEDAIVSKLYRICQAAHRGALDGQETLNSQFLREGLIDDVVMPSNLEDTLDEVVRLRRRTTELLSKTNYQEVKSHIETYKGRKDMFDILAIINAERDGVIKIDRATLKQGIKSHRPDLAKVC